MLLCWGTTSTFSDQRWYVANNNMAGATPYEMQCYWTYGGGFGSVSQKYGNYYFDVTPPNLQQGTFNAFSVDLGGTCYYNIGYNSIKIFIDFNQDGDFTDGGEEVFVSPTQYLLLHRRWFNVQPVEGNAGRLNGNS